MQHAAMTTARDSSTMPNLHSAARSWDYGPLDASLLKDRANFYASAAGAGNVLRGEQAAEYCEEITLCYALSLDQHSGRDSRATDNAKTPATCILQVNDLVNLRGCVEFCLLKLQIAFCAHQYAH